MRDFTARSSIVLSIVLLSLLAVFSGCGTSTPTPDSDSEETVEDTPLPEEEPAFFPATPDLTKTSVYETGIARIGETEVAQRDEAETEVAATEEAELKLTATALAEELAETATVIAIETEEAHDQETRVAIQKTQPDTPAPPAIVPPTPTPTFTPIPKPAVVPTPRRVGFVLPSKYKGRPSVKFDIAGHICCIVFPAEIEITAEEPAVTLIGPLPWVPVSGERKADGSIVATGVGKVAGFDNIAVKVTGFISDTVSLDYTFGDGGGLPQNQPMIWHVDGERVEPPIVLDVPQLILDEKLNNFVQEFIAAQRAQDETKLYSYLHPAVIDLYGEAQCRNFIHNNPSGSDYNLQITGVSGPKDWNYNPDGRSIPIMNVWYVNGFVTAQGQTDPRELHFAVTPTLIGIFMDCGEPL